jgi:hypothetical protein
MSLLAIVPSRGRPAAARECLASFEEMRRDPKSRLIFVVDADDRTRRDYPRGHTHLVSGHGSMGSSLHAAATDQELLADATTVGMAGDDNRFRTPGFDVTLDEYLTANIGIAYGDDGFQHEKLPTCWWLSRPIVNKFGLAHPELRHFYMDNYWLELGQSTGSLRYFPDVLIEHLHPLAHKATWDAVYTRGHTHAAHDKRWFRDWQREGKRHDVARLKGILGTAGPRRILADWHHPALWESLSILFEERFGWELYSPLGIEWTDHGWTFEHTSIGWGPADFLEFPDAVQVGDHYERTEPEYPARPRKMVTVAQAETMRWDFVLASVSVHQRPFERLARRYGARLIHQVGNAKHAVDRNVRAVVLASSAAAPRAPNVIPYHQEFDRSLFSDTPAKNLDAVTSLMLRLDSTSGDWRWMAEAAGVNWLDIGGADPRDRHYLAPMTKVADRIRNAGWIWHDKKIGDGYGHVLHNAAAMGRPLIGHASHYSGQLGEPFWRDLETCIDLDRHPPERALRLFRAINADPDWHRAISDELVATFDRLIDFDAEAERIHAALA